MINQKEFDKKFEDLCKKYQERDSVENILILLDDNIKSDLMKKIIVIWDKVTLRRKSCDNLHEIKEAQDWRWLWLHVEYDLEEICDIIGKEIPENIMMMLIGNRLIFPDGMVSANALKLIKKEIVTKLMGVKEDKK